MFDTKACGRRIKELRHHYGLTQEDFADQLNTSKSHITKVENGQRGASIDLYIEIAQYFDVSLYYLLLGQNCMSGQMKADLEDVIVKLQRISDRI